MILLPLLVTLCPAQTPPSAERHFIAKGEPMPAFELRDAAGAAFSSARLDGKPCVVLFVRPDSENSSALLHDLKRAESALRDSPWERVIIVPGATEPEIAQKVVGAVGVSGAVLLDPERTAYALFRVVAVPSIAVFGKDGKATFSHAGYGVAVYAQMLAHLREVLGGPRPAGEAEGLRATPRVQMARRLLELGELDHAEAMLEKETEGAPSLEASLTYAELLLKRKRPEKALALLRTAKKSYPASPRLDVGIAGALASQGNQEEAIKVLRDVIQISPQIWEAHFTLGEIYEARGEKERAISSYKEAIAVLRSPWRGGKK